jgi:TrmH family RNA methyltransferase
LRFVIAAITNHKSRIANRESPMKRISGRQHALVRAYRDLVREPDPAGVRLLLDGAHLIREAHDAALVFESLVIASSRLDRERRGGPSGPPATEERALAEMLERKGVDVAVAGDQTFAAVSPVRTPSGIVAIVHRHPTTVDAILEQARLFALVLVNVQDPGNVGSLMRVAEAGGVTGIIVAGESANPFAWKAVRGSMGSVLRLPVARSVSTDAVMQDMRKTRTKVIAAVPRDGWDPDAVDWSGRIALMLGGEGPGLSPQVIAAADERVTIPMESPVESLNVAASAAIIIYAARRARRQ